MTRLELAAIALVVLVALADVFMACIIIWGWH